MIPGLLVFTGEQGLDLLTLYKLTSLKNFNPDLAKEYQFF